MPAKGIPLEPNEPRVVIADMPDEFVSGSIGTEKARETIPPAAKLIEPWIFEHVYAKLIAKAQAVQT